MSDEYCPLCGDELYDDEIVAGFCAWCESNENESDDE